MPEIADGRGDVGHEYMPNLQKPINRIQGDQAIPPLPELIRQGALSIAG